MVTEFRTALRAGVVSAVLCASPALGARAQQPVRASLDSLLSVPVNAASKYAQKTADAAASVTIVTADEIRQHGYRNLEELLENVRGLYVSNDRNYTYLGTRGFSRPTDYNNRVLLLVDGHTVNDDIWGSGPAGSDFPINLDAIERIEFVRGPGSALYGTSAMFGVINIVTRTGADVNGARVTARSGTANAREVAVVAGRSFGLSNAVSFSALLSRRDGADLYYPEFDAPQTNFGVARGLDWEDGLSTFGTIERGDVRLRVGYYTRAKGIPTAAYGAAFGDPRAETVDGSAWTELSARKEIRGVLNVSARAYADRYRYRGAYPADPAAAAYQDGAKGTSFGTEAILVWDPVSHDRLTLGAELRRVAQAEYYEQFEDGTQVRDHALRSIGAVFVQNELQLHPRATLVTGARLDARSNAQGALSPRAAFILNPGQRSTVKLLYGEAFRAPSAAEADMNTSYYVRNPALRAERIRTYEIEVQHRLISPVQIGGSLYGYRVRNLIDQVADPNGLAAFQNVAAASAEGAELQVDVIPSGPLSGRLTYALQHARDASTDERMTNSPERIASAIVQTRFESGFRSALTVRNESGRRTIAGDWTRGFTRADLNVGYGLAARAVPSWLRAADMSLRVTNLFDVAYSTPAGFEHQQVAIPMDGRAISLRLDWRF